jgi:hypothetical protein
MTGATETEMIRGQGSEWDVGSEKSARIWNERWARKVQQMPKADWENFRRDEILMDGFQDRDNLFEMQFTCCVVEKVPADLMKDSGIGNPCGRVLGGNNFCTATSMRHGRYINSIRRNLVGLVGLRRSSWRIFPFTNTCL